MNFIARRQGGTKRVSILQVVLSEILTLSQLLRMECRSEKDMGMCNGIEDLRVSRGQKHVLNREAAALLTWGEE